MVNKNKDNLIPAMRSHEEIMEEEKKAMDEAVVPHEEVKEEEKPCVVKSHDEIMKEEREAVKRQLQALVEVRHLEEGEYFEKATPEYELILEHHEKTLHISLHTVKGKNFHLRVCEGEHQLANGLLALDIFQAFKYEPQTCQVNHHEGVLAIETRYIVGRREKKERKEVKMQDKELSETSKLKLQFSRLLTKMLQHKKEDEQEIVNKYQQRELQSKNNLEQQEKKYEEQKQNYQNEKRQFIRDQGNYKNKMQEFEKIYQKITKFLVNQTTSSFSFYSLDKNKITREEKGEENSLLKMVMLDLIIGGGEFSFRTYIHNLNGGIRFGVIDRVAHMKETCFDFSHSIVYGSGGRIYFSIGSGQSKKLSTQALQQGAEVLVKVDKSNCEITFKIVKRGRIKSTYGVYSPILNEPNRQFVPAFQTSSVGASISWELI